MHSSRDPRVGRINDTPTSMTMLHRVRSGDENAWQSLVDFYSPVVYERCRRSGFGSADSSDISQEVFLAVARNIHRFKRDRPRDRFLHWFQTIVSSKLRDFARRRSVRPEPAAGGTIAQQRFQDVSDPNEDSAALTLTGDWKAELVHRALEVMRSDFFESTWQAFWMSAVEGRSSSEVAELLEMSRASVRQAKSRVRKRLADELGDEFLRSERH